ncbi:hypothetical protein Q5P01_016208 [Channa striata]|uniref:Uncharacterized protein n=1 Tax=Channa striata TaxID=64152 RepID=A0AA88MD16_CHASR|nr:hypothetical protein Q5P01_016208 [Channa striata]
MVDGADDGLLNPNWGLANEEALRKALRAKTAGPISRELRHDSDLRRLVAGGCDSERKRKEGRRGGGKKRDRERELRGEQQKQREVEGVRDGMSSPPSPRDAEMNSWP